MASPPTSPEQKKAKKMKMKKKKKDKSYTLQELKDLGMQLLSSRSYINNAPILLSFISPSSPPPHALESLMSLQSFFIPLLPDLPPSSSSKSPLSSDKDEPESVYRLWLRSKYDQFVGSLINLALCSEAENVLRDVSLDAIMEFVKLGKGGTFQSAIYDKLLRSIVHTTSSDDYLLDLLISKFFKYIDVRYFAYISIAKLSKSFEANDNTGNATSRDGFGGLRSSVEEFSVHKMYGILSQVPPFEGHPDLETWSQSVFASKKADQKLPSESLLVGDGARKLQSNNDALPIACISRKMKSKFTEAWTSFLRLPLPLDVYKEVLVSLHQMVIPYMAKPSILCDFLTRSYDIGGVISVMALSSLFILMTEHGLEYPNFYEKLYGLLVPAVFMAKHRARFFQLLDSCLKSSLLPAYLAAAFTKKLSRLALSVPPSGALVIIALIHNLLRRHPSINCLVHQQADDENGEEPGAAPEGEHGCDEVARESDAASRVLAQKPGLDLFNNEEVDPAKSNAMRSSLWEIDTLRHHYCPAVSRFVTSLENDLTARAKTCEITVKDFSSGSYATIFKDEIRRRVKQVPLAFYKSTPTALFSESDFPGWTFGFGSSEELGAKKTGESDACQEDNTLAKRQKVEHS